MMQAEQSLNSPIEKISSIYRAVWFQDEIVGRGGGWESFVHLPPSIVEWACFERGDCAAEASFSGTDSWRLCVE